MDFTCNKGKGNYIQWERELHLMKTEYTTFDEERVNYVHLINRDFHCLRGRGVKGIWVQNNWTTYVRLEESPMKREAYQRVCSQLWNATFLSTYVCMHVVHLHAHYTSKLVTCETGLLTKGSFAWHRDTLRKFHTLWEQSVEVVTSTLPKTWKQAQIIEKKLNCKICVNHTNLEIKTTKFGICYNVYTSRMPNETNYLP